MGRSPDGVAIGVSGEAQTGQSVDTFHCHAPSVHTAIVCSQALGGQDMPGVSQAAPSFGTIGGQGADGVTDPWQDQTGVPSG
jgi:hypothetical protein